MNVMRQKYRELTEEEKQDLQTMKDLAESFYDLLCTRGDSREISIAKTKIEEAVMWATKAMTK
jgi:ClpP class serine protease